MALIDIAIQEFRDAFTNEYQQLERKTANTTQVYTGLIGDSYKVPVAGEIVLHDRGAYHSNIAATIPTYTRPIITFKEKTALIPSDIFEQTNVNVSERQNYARITASSISRVEDQILVDALNDSTTTNEIVDGGTNMSVEKLIEAKLLLDKANVPMKDRYVIAHANQQKPLLNDSDVTSADYNTTRVLVNGTIDSYLGFKFIWIGDMTEGGVPKTGDIRTCFVYHYDAMAMGYKLNPTVTTDWDARSQSWLIIPKVILGAIDVLPKGVVKIDCDETA